VFEVEATHCCIGIFAPAIVEGIYPGTFEPGEASEGMEGMSFKLP